MSRMVDVCIVGGGPVGLFAAFYAGMRGMSVRIIDSLQELGGQLTALYPEKFVYDMPGFPEVLAKDLATAMITQALQFGAEVALDEVATTLEPSEGGWTIRGASGAAYSSRTVIISAGAGAFSPTKLGVEREEAFLGRGLTYGLKDTSLVAGKRVAVIGGGDSAFDWALHVLSAAKSVTLVHRRDQFRAHEESVDRLRASSADILVWKTVHALHGADTLNRITLEDTQTKELSELDADSVIVSIGYKSSLGPIKTWGLELEKNQIVVNDRCETNLPGVFAVGDVATHGTKLKLIATGVGEATTAVCVAKTLIDPDAKLFPGHSSDIELPARTT